MGPGSYGSRILFMPLSIETSTRPGIHGDIPVWVSVDKPTRDNSKGELARDDRLEGVNGGIAKIDISRDASFAATGGMVALRDSAGG
jgi:hypothetical protein